VFDDPSIVKVLHGADYDITWLQRDFSIYIVNLFDTGQAARVLGHKSFKLSSLLQNYCQVLADKKYQLADWRQRPLTNEMLKYAREDTHYLLYIYDCLRKELLEAGAKQEHPHCLLKSVFQKSQALCLQQYKKPELKDYNYYMMIGRHSAIQTLQQISVLKALIKLRDYIART